uniref:Uncharacterized protein n=1 Tax=Sipha flava TaxID=143950 RepID=A0A2S2QD87_9HEMI
MQSFSRSCLNTRLTQLLNDVGLLKPIACASKYTCIRIHLNVEKKKKKKKKIKNLHRPSRVSGYNSRHLYRTILVPRRICTIVRAIHDFIVLVVFLSGRRLLK